jgi:hypothetical protein
MLPISQEHWHNDGLKVCGGLHEAALGANDGQAHSHVFGLYVVGNIHVVCDIDAGH